MPKAPKIGAKHRGHPTAPQAPEAAPKAPEPVYYGPSMADEHEVRAAAYRGRHFIFDYPSTYIPNWSETPKFMMSKGLCYGMWATPTGESQMTITMPLRALQRAYMDLYPPEMPDGPAQREEGAVLATTTQDEVTPPPLPR